MIDKLQIDNFQRHGKLRIQFDPAVTVITGPSDVGKSSILRAIRWVATNRPSGDAFIRDGSDSVTVQLGVDDRRVKRAKGKANLYQLDSKQFKAFGQDVPPEIRSLLNLGSINYQSQHDAPFWFALTAGEVAKEINAIIDLSVIDRVLGYIASEGRRAKSEAGVVTKRRDAAQGKLDSLDYVVPLDEDLTEVEQLTNQVTALDAQIDALTRLGRDASKHKVDSRRLTGAIHAARTTLKSGERYRGLIDRQTKLSEMIDTAVAYDNKARFKLPDVGPITGAKDKLDQVEIRSSKLTTLVDDIMCVQNLIERQKESGVIARNKLDKFTGGRCPVCGGAL